MNAAPLDPALNFPAGTVFTIWETDNPYLKKYLRTAFHKATGFNVVQTQSTGVMARVDSESLVDAGARGIGALVLGFGGPDQVAEKNRVYREAYANRDPEQQVGFRPTVSPPHTNRV